MTRICMDGEDVLSARDAARDACVAILQRHGYDVPGIADLCAGAALRAYDAEMGRTLGRLQRAVAGQADYARVTVLAVDVRSLLRLHAPAQG